MTTQLADQPGRRILRGTAATITYVNVDQDGKAVAPVAGFTVGVTRGDGSVLVASSTAATVGSDGVVSVVLTPAQTALLDRLTATWTDVTTAATFTTYHDIVGGYYISLANLRWQTNIGDDSKFPDNRLIEARAWFEREFEDVTGTAWVPRYRRSVRSGSSLSAVTGSIVYPVASDLYLPGRNVIMLGDTQVRSVRSVRIYTDATTYTAFNAGELADLNVTTSGELIRRTLGSWPAGDHNIVVEYEYGYDQPPSDVVEAAKIAIADRLTTANAGNRQYALSTAAGIVRSSTPGDKTPFGIPFVDEVAMRRGGDRLPVFA